MTATLTVTDIDPVTGLLTTWSKAIRRWTKVRPSYDPGMRTAPNGGGDGARNTYKSGNGW